LTRGIATENIPSLVDNFLLLISARMPIFHHSFLKTAKNLQK